MSVVLGMRNAFLMALAGILLVSCSGGEPAATHVQLTGQKIYWISQRDRAQIQYRVLDTVNAVRRRKGVGPVNLSPQLNAAAATHARDMSVQNRPWHFGSDRSSPLDRARGAGFQGNLLGENISETYETETQTLAAWMRDPYARQVILHPRAHYMGIAWYQEVSGKIWWTQVFGE